MERTTCRVGQPWGRDKGRQSSWLSDHATIAEAFRALDAVSEQMQRTGAPSDAIELIVADTDGNVVPRPDAH